MRRLLILVIVLLTSCGASSSETPEKRVEDFITATVAAFNNRDLANETKQDELAGQLAAYFVPESQAAQKQSFKESLTRMAQINAVVTLEQLSLTKTSENATTATVRINTGWLELNVGGNNNQIDLKQEGLISDSDTATLRKIDGIWYIEP